MDGVGVEVTVKDLMILISSLIWTISYKPRKDENVNVDATIKKPVIHVKKQEVLVLMKK
jgi:hypothetical protein